MRFAQVEAFGINCKKTLKSLALLDVEKHVDNVNNYL